MYLSIKIRKSLVHQLKTITILLLFFYYLGLNLPRPVIQAWALFGFLVVPLLVIRRWKQFCWVVTKDLILLLLIVSVPLSSLWSTNPDITLAYSRAFICSTAFGIYLATCYTPKELMRLLIWLFSIYTVINLIVPLIIPSYGIYGGWRGISNYKNSLAATMVMAAMLFLDMHFYGRRYRWCALIGASIAFVILMLSKGRGSLGIFIGLLPLLPFYKIVKQEYKLKMLLGICAIFICGIIVLTASTNLEFIVVNLLGKQMDLTGRAPLWEYLIDKGLERPWFGYGYAGFWTDPTESLGVALRFSWIEGVGEGGGNSHSSYIEAFLQLGWLGLSLTLLSLLMVLIRIVLLLGLTKQIEFFWMLQFLLLVIIISYSDSMGFLDYRNFFWVLYVSTAYSSAIHLNRIFKNCNKIANFQT
ncbi:hypothetical protein CAL7716_044450 [Calothrix sp. PCC 7716]|nr:hypothetical protein CAL7716_044450 [Calothrix sp. PCC 7716]